MNNSVRIEYSPDTHSIIAIVLLVSCSVRGADFNTLAADTERKKDNVALASFPDLGLSFDYPGNWILTNNSAGAIVRLVSIESSAGSSFRIFVYPSAILSADQLQKTATRAFRSGASKPPRSKDFQEKDAKREFTNATRSGKSFQDTWESKNRITEFFTFEHEGAVIQIMLQYFEDEAEEALKGIKIISDSLKHKKVPQADREHQPR
jgi:hypothetical protein